jgi:hypothetical protein
MSKAENELIRLMAKLAYDPLGFVIASYPWGQGQLKGFDGPDDWQRKMLEDVGTRVRENRFDGVKPVSPLLFKRQSGHGIGKSAMAAWLTNWICSTRPHCKGTVSANTEKQVKTKTWGEIRKWFGLSLTSHWFEVKAESVRHKLDSQMEVNIQSSKEENFNSFSGQHAIDSTSFYILDESSTIPEKIWETMMGGLTDGEPMVFAFGNPVLNSGYFHRIDKGIQRKYWNIGEIDSRTCRLTNKEELNRQIEEYGIDSDFVRVRILGKAPKSDNLQFITEEIVEAAASRTLSPDQYYHAPIILAGDPAWQGEDPHVLGKRQGLQFVVLAAPRHLPHETVGFVNLIAQATKEHKSDAEFIDMHGIGGGTYDQLCRLGFSPILCNSVGTDMAEKHCANNRMQMWWNMREWLKSGGCIPNDPLLKADLVAPHCYLMETGAYAGKYMLESKKDMKSRGIDSPGRAEVLAYTFFQPVVRRPHGEADIEFDSKYMHGTLKDNNYAKDYNPLEYR